jgi:hypothetical protein
MSECCETKRCEDCIRHQMITVPDDWCFFAQEAIRETGTNHCAVYKRKKGNNSMTKTLNLYYVCDHNSVMKLRVSEFEDGPVPVLWNNRGACVLIDANRIANFLQEAEDYIKQNPPEPDVVLKTFYWDDCIPVPVEVARALISSLKHGDSDSEDRADESTKGS